MEVTFYNLNLAPIISLIFVLIGFHYNYFELIKFQIFKNLKGKTEITCIKKAQINGLLNI
jgi:hypothetical protein